MLAEIAIKGCVMNRLKHRREELGLTQLEVARKANIKRSLYSVIELGICKPSLPVALSIAEVLQTTVEDLFGHLKLETGDESIEEAV